MAFNQPQRGWTAMSLAPDPDKFARANNTINATINPNPLPTAPVTTPVTSPVVAPAALTPGYQKLQQNIFPSLAQQQMSTQTAPSTAYTEAAKQIEQSPWNTKPAAAPKNFLDPTTGQPTAQKVPAAKTNGWVGALPQI